MDVSTAQMRTSAKDMRITGVKTLDIRFPTPRSLDGSDAMNADPDYSAAYVILQTDSARAPGYSITMKPESLEHYAFPNGGAWINE